MFNNCYHPGCHFDMNRCNNKNNWEKDYDDKDKDCNRHECCFPIDICFSVKEGKKDFDKREKDFEYRNNEKQNYGYQNDYDYEEKDGYDYQENYGYDYNKQKGYDKRDDEKDYDKHDDKKCKHECCFPIDICFSVKESKKDKKEDDDDCGRKNDKHGRDDWKNNDRCEWDRNRDCNRGQNNCNNNFNNCRCCLGLLCGGLFGCRRR